LVRIIIIVILEANGRLLDTACGKRYHARQVTPPPEKIELYSSKKGEKGESID
jgi:hypothetical protein